MRPPRRIPPPTAAHRCLHALLRLPHPPPGRLWKLGEPDKTLNELRRLPADDLTAQQLARYVKLDNRDGIRTRNHDRAK